jgi:hypothetical protein
MTTPATRAGAHLPTHCQCPACYSGLIHASDCAVHNAPAEPIGACDCGVTAAYIAAIYEKVPE